MVDQAGPSARAAPGTAHATMPRPDRSDTRKLHTAHLTTLIHMSLDPSVAHVALARVAG